MARTATIAAACLLVGLACGSCSSPDVQPAAPSMRTSPIQSTEAPSVSPDRAPTVAQVDAMLLRAVNPEVPALEKIDLVQGATAADAPLFDDLVKLREANPQFMWQIGKPVLEQPGIAKVPVSGLLGGANQTANATLAFDGTWKLERDYACQVVAQTGRIAPSCQPPTPPT